MALQNERNVVHMGAEMLCEFLIIALAEFQIHNIPPPNSEQFCASFAHLLRRPKTKKGIRPLNA